MYYDSSDDEDEEWDDRKEARRQRLDEADKLQALADGAGPSSVTQPNDSARKSIRNKKRSVRRKTKAAGDVTFPTRSGQVRCVRSIR